VRLLLDTHTLLWHAANDARLSRPAFRELSDPTNEFFLSMSTVWEVAIKSGLKKLTLALPFPVFIASAIEKYPLTLLPITFDDCTYYETLGFPLANHRDPFDRMIVTHTIRHGLTVVGNDSKLDAYGIPRLW
jgi:PIN domain nuclease of toxin-antitoxin system